MFRTTISFLLLVIASASAFSQQTRIYTDPLKTYQNAKDLYQKEQYSLAYPMFRQLQENRRETDYANYRIPFEEVDYYAVVCGLKQMEQTSEEQAKSFVAIQNNLPLKQKMAFHLGEYYFRKADYRNAIVMYEQTNIDNLSNREIADMKFHQGYGYFTLQQFDKAKPALNAIRPRRIDTSSIAVSRIELAFVRFPSSPFEPPLLRLERN